MAQNENRPYTSKTGAGADGSCEFSVTRQKAKEHRDRIVERQKKADVQRHKMRVADRERQYKRAADLQKLKLRIQKAYEVETVGRRKYRRYMSKDVQVGRVRRIIEGGLDRRISRHSFDDELHDDSISGDTFAREAVSDYKKEFSRKCDTPTTDTNNDGVVNQDDDVIMTPGMRKMSRYL